MLVLTGNQYWLIYPGLFEFAVSHAENCSSFRLSPRDREFEDCHQIDNRVLQIATLSKSYAEN